MMLFYGHMEKQNKYFSVIFLVLFGYLVLDSLGLWSEPLSRSSQKITKKEVQYSMPRWSESKRQSHQARVKSDEPEKQAHAEKTSEGSSQQAGSDLKALNKLANEAGASKDSKDKKALKKKANDAKKVAQSGRQKEVLNKSMRSRLSFQKSTVSPSIVKASGSEKSENISRLLEEEVSDELNTSVIPSVERLLADYKNKKVNDETFFSVLEILLMERTKESQRKVLQALYGVYSSKSFAFAVTQRRNAISDVGSRLRAYTYSYGVDQKVGYLYNPLRSGQDELVIEASQVFLAGIETAFRAQKSQATKEIYLKFTQSFQQLSKSNNTQIAQLAQKALRRIESLSLNIVTAHNSQN